MLRIFRKISITSWVLNVCGLAQAEEVKYFPIVFPHSFGSDVLNQAMFAADVTTVLVDGAKTAFPPSSTTLDRTLLSYSRAAAVHALTPDWRIRFSLAMEVAMRKTHTDSQPRTTSSALASRLEPSLDLIYKTSTAMELGFGVEFTHSPEYTSTELSAILESTTTYAEYQLMQQRFSLIKRGGFGSGGLYYKVLAQTNRSVKVEFEDNPEPSRVSDQRVHKPTTLGIVAQVNLAGGVFFGEFQAISAGEGGERKPDSNKTVEDDYTQIRLVYTKPYTPDMALNFGLTHKTLSYASREDTRLDLVPMWALHLGTKMKIMNFDCALNGVYLYANDLQSEEEFNQRFQIKGYGLTASLMLSSF